MRRISKLIASIIIAAAVVGAPSFGTAPSAQAATEPSPDTAADEVTWSVRPADGERGSNRSTLMLDAAPGAQQQDALTVTNYSGRELTLDVYAATAALGTDGIPVAGAQADASPSDPANWVTFAQSEVVIPASSSMTVPFTVTVPFDAEPGDHAVALLTSWISSQDIAVDRRLGIRGYFHVGGESAPSAVVEDVRIDAPVPADPFATRDVGVSFTLRNDGNMRLTSTAVISLTDAAGRGLGGTLAAEPRDGAGFALIDGGVPDLGPGESVEVHAVLTDVSAPVATLAARIDVGAVTFADGEEIQVPGATAWMWSIPWIVVAVIVLVMACAVLIPVLRRRSRARFDERVAAAVRDRQPEAVVTG